MAINKAQKEKILEEMRQKNKSYSSKVKKVIEQMEESHLKKKENIVAYIERLKALKEGTHSSYTELGNHLGLSHTAIEKQMPNLEGKGSSEFLISHIDKFFLELFSLLFQVSPLYLANYTDNTGQYEMNGHIDPFFECEQTEIVLCNTIIFNLFTDDRKRVLLCDFAKLCDAKDTWRTKVKNNLLLSPLIKNAFETEECPKELTFVPYEFRLQNPSHRNTITACFSIFRRMQRIDFDLIFLFYCISKSEQLCNAVHNWLEYGGFLNKPKAFCGKLTVEKCCNGNFNVKYDEELPPDGGNYVPF